MKVKVEVQFAADNKMYEKDDSYEVDDEFGKQLVNAGLAKEVKVKKDVKQ